MIKLYIKRSYNEDVCNSYLKCFPISMKRESYIEAIRRLLRMKIQYILLGHQTPVTQSLRDRIPTLLSAHVSCRYLENNVHFDKGYKCKLCHIIT